MAAFNSGRAVRSRTAWRRRRSSNPVVTAGNMADTASVTSRIPEYPIDPLFLERWSPRAFDGSPLPEADLQAMFEAARWAPSAFNSQPWHFLYARRGDANWARFLSLLIPWNQSWAHSASVLVYIVSDTLPMTDRKTGEPAPSTTHSFDAGAAWVIGRDTQLDASIGWGAHGDAPNMFWSVGVSRRF